VPSEAIQQLHLLSSSHPFALQADFNAEMGNWFNEVYEPVDVPSTQMHLDCGGYVSAR
jgi:hypothetical protein